MGIDEKSGWEILLGKERSELNVAMMPDANKGTMETTDESTNDIQPFSSLHPVLDTNQSSG